VAETLELVSLIAYSTATLLLIGALLAAAWWLGSKKEGESKGIAYESGIIPSGSARLAVPVPFYLVAIFFIVFDVESAFIFTWAAAWRELGLEGLVHMTLFIVVLLLGLVWLCRKGGLDWGPSRSR
jgi:NADH-quinone oxidoreductase subunit A